MKGRFNEVKKKARGLHNKHTLVASVIRSLDSLTRHWRGIVTSKTPGAFVSGNL